MIENARFIQGNKIERQIFIYRKKSKLILFGSQSKSQYKLNQKTAVEIFVDRNLH
ncbi:hypothetical protein KFK09_024831 [Dendrobium nobile]|uniref:Uncharacterized protein n=1 Tax=Dendrobium nobile TaxID=94219 RepID=A0A8T3AEV7_DENNO|nr:hypothetical protein KFK09_024831 [Dendrobium nobile]